MDQHVNAKLISDEWLIFFCNNIRMGTEISPTVSSNKLISVQCSALCSVAFNIDLQSPTNKCARIEIIIK